MVEQEIVIKPSRSDEVLDPNQQLQMTNQVKAFFDSMVPNRPSKPNRSDPDDSYVPPAVPTTIPELDKLQSLRSNTVFSSTNATVAAENEFVETQYYKQLDSIDKQHHATGSGFIKVLESENNGESDWLQMEPTGNYGGYNNKDLICKSNPATNDWIPCLDHDDQIEKRSSKPNRSENC